jgi:HAD superfamily hydrolase (TIGR01509 family)
MRYNAVIFDCDGVLVDSETLSCTATADIMNARGIKTDLQEVKRFIGKSKREIFKYFEARDGIRIDVEPVNQAIVARYMEMADRLRPMPGVTDVLLKLSASKIPLAVASSGNHTQIRFSLEKTGLLPYFKVVCSAFDVPRGKPDPDLFLYAAQRLQAAPDRCVVVEDSVYGIAAGKRAEMLTIGYASSFSEAELCKAGADLVIRDFGSFFKVV